MGSSNWGLKAWSLLKLLADLFEERLTRRGDRGGEGVRILGPLLTEGGGAA